MRNICGIDSANRTRGDRATNGPNADFVGIDNDTGMQLVIDHLEGLGVRTIGYAGSDDATSNGVERWDAVQRISQRRGIEVVGQFRGEFSVACGVAAVEKLLDGRDLPDAIVASSDSIAAGVLKRLRERQVRVPEDILVTGYDGSEIADVVWPTLTTVVQPVGSIAADAVAFLVNRIEGESGPFRRNRLMPSLQLGASTEARDRD